MLTVHAHPDDEASKGAPTLARYHDEGVRTVLVCCTGGEEGDLQNPALRNEGQPFHGLTPEQEKEVLAHLRPAELARSAEAIGFDEVIMLGYRDSGMAESIANNHPACFHMADLDEAVGRLVTIIRRTKPQVIVTYSDDQSGYPHPDHIRVHEISELAFHRSGDPIWYPWAGPVWQPMKMYYTVWSKARLLAIHHAMLELRGSSPYDDKWLDRPSQDDRITTRLARRRTGCEPARRHCAPTPPRSTRPSRSGSACPTTSSQRSTPMRTGCWRAARSAARHDGEIEDDLFRGVRSGDRGER